MATDPLSEVRLGDLTTFLAVMRSDSMSAAARELRVTTSQVSKAMVRLESQFGVRLLARTSRGVVLSEAGRRAMPHIEQALKRLRLVGACSDRPHLSIADPSSLIDAFLPAIAAATPEFYVRGMVLPNALLFADATAGGFDATLMTSDVERLPSSWASVVVGELRQALFASPTTAGMLGPEPVPRRRVEAMPFVVPMYSGRGHFVAVEDDCPLPFRDRIVGHEAETISLALGLAAETAQVVFGPVVAAHEHLRTGRLVEVRVQDWESRDTLYLACNGERILSRIQQAMVRAVRAVLRERDAPKSRSSRPPAGPPESVRGARKRTST